MKVRELEVGHIISWKTPGRNELHVTTVLQVGYILRFKGAFKVLTVIGDEETDESLTLPPHIISRRQMAKILKQAKGITMIPHVMEGNNS